MDSPNPHLQLRVPTPDKQALSFAEASPQGMARWITGLPKANLGETARLLYQSLTELNQLITPTQNRLQLLELLRPEVHFVCKHLERHFLNQTIVLDERPRKVANLCQALQNHLAIGYKLVVAQETIKFRKEQPQTLTLALQRALHSLFGPLVRASQLYCPVPDGLWLELHQLYRLARRHALHNISNKDPLAPHPGQHSIETTYLAAILLGCARTNQMRQNAIANLADVLEPWSAQVVVQSAASSSSLFAIPHQVDGPPRYKSLFKETDLADLLGIDPTPLLDSIHSHLQLPVEERQHNALLVTERLSVEQLQHLQAAWGDIAERTFRRNPTVGTMNLCIGMSAVHFYLAGQRSFNDVLKSLVEDRSAHFGEKPNSKSAAPDIWSNAFDAQPVAAWERGVPLEDIQYKTPNNASGGFAAAADEQYPVHSLRIVNHSPGGYCLSWPKDVPGQLQAGELRGVQAAEKKEWSVAVVRWIRQVRGGGTQMGIELIAPNATPCGLQLIRKTEQSSQYLRALLLPEIRAIARPATLITPRMPFQEGNKVRINLNGDEKRAILCRRQTCTGSFSQYEFRNIDDTLASKEQPVTATKTKGGSGEEDFDSLWKSL